MFEDIIARDDIPNRTDLGHIPHYNVPKNKTQLYGEQAGNCNGCGEHFQTQHLEIDHIAELMATPNPQIILPSPSVMRYPIIVQ